MYPERDLIWVILDGMTKYTIFLPVKSIDIGKEYVRLYIGEIVRLHRVPLLLFFHIVVLNSFSVLKLFHQG